MTAVDQLTLTFRLARTPADLGTLVALRDAAARWQMTKGIAQWRVGELKEDHFRRRIAVGEVWMAFAAHSGRCAGAWELWWADPLAWGRRAEPAGHIHRLMVNRDVATAGTGRRLLAAAEHRVLQTGRRMVRLTCAHDNGVLRAYYAANAYDEVGQCPYSWPSGYPVALFEKRLDAADNGLDASRDGAGGQALP